MVSREVGAGHLILSAVNATEVLTKLIDLGASAEDALGALLHLQPSIVPFTSELADAAARLRPATRQFGLSLGDRACLALAIDLALPVLTADRRWAELQLPIPVVLTR